MPDYTNATEAQAYLKRALKTKHRKVISRTVCALSEAGWELSLGSIELEFVKPRGILKYNSGIISIQQYEKSDFVTIIDPIEQITS